MSDETPIATTPAKISLREQAEEAHRELVRRHKSYPYQVKDGKMTPAEAEVGYSVMRAMRDTMRLFAEFETEVRVAVKKAIEARREIENDAGAHAILEAFPDAAVLEVHDREEQLEFMGSGSDRGDALEGLFVAGRPVVEGPTP